MGAVVVGSGCILFKMFSTHCIVCLWCLFVCLNLGQGGIITQKLQVSSPSPCPEEGTSTYCLDPPNYPSIQISEALANNPNIGMSGLFETARGSLETEQDNIRL